MSNISVIIYSVSESPISLYKGNTLIKYSSSSDSNSSTERLLHIFTAIIKDYKQSLDYVKRFLQQYNHLSLGQFLNTAQNS